MKSNSYKYQTEMLIQLLSASYGHDKCGYAEVQCMAKLIDDFGVSISDMEDVALDEINWKDYKSVARNVAEAVVYNVFDMKDDWSIKVYLPGDDGYIDFHFKALNREMYDEMVHWLWNNHTQEYVLKFLKRFTRENGKD